MRKGEKLTSVRKPPVVGFPTPVAGQHLQVLAELVLPVSLRNYATINEMRGLTSLDLIAPRLTSSMASSMAARISAVDAV